MTVYALIAPKQQWEDANGNPYVGAKLFTYVAGSTTKKTTYTESDGLTPNANPIVLNSRGECPNNVFGSTGAYKLVLAPATDTDPPLSPYWTVDNVTGTNDVAGTNDEWIASGMTPTYISGTSFSVVGDQTAILQVNRRLKITIGGGTRYATILTSSFGAGLTTLTLTMDSGTIDNTISAFWYGLLSATNPSIPGQFVTTTTQTMVLLGTTTIAAAANMDFSNLLSSTYDDYLLVIPELAVATDDDHIMMRVGTGATPTWITGNDYAYAAYTGYSAAAAGTYHSGDSTSDNINGAMLLTPKTGTGVAVGNAVTEGFSCEIKIYKPSSASKFKRFSWTSSFIRPNGTGSVDTGGGQWLNNNAITSLRITFSAGVGTGIGYLYGIRKA